MVRTGKGAIPNEVRALALGCLMGINGKPMAPKMISALIKEQYKLDINPKTLQNWVPQIDAVMKKYGITHQHIEEVMIRAMAGKPIDITVRQSEEDAPVEDQGPLRGGSLIPNAREGTKTVSEAIRLLEGQGFIVSKDLQDILSLLEQEGYNVLRKGQLQIGPQILDISPITLDFDALGKSIAVNPIIQFYYSLGRRVNPSLDPAEFITACVIDAMVARKWNMAVVIG